MEVEKNDEEELELDGGDGDEVELSRNSLPKMSSGDSEKPRGEVIFLLHFTPFVLIFPAHL